MIYQMHWAASETAGQDGHDGLVVKMDRLCLRPSHTADISAARMNATVGPLLAQRAGIVTRSDEVTCLYQSLRTALSEVRIRDKDLETPKQV